VSPSATQLKKIDTKAPGASFGASVGSALKTAALAAALDFLNNMIKEWIADMQADQQIEARFAKLQPEIDAMLEKNPKEVHAVISINKWWTTTDKVTQAGVEEKTGFKMVSVHVEVTDHSVKPDTKTEHKDLGMGAIDFEDVTYSVLIVDVEKELEKQRIARDEETLKQRMGALAKENAGRPQPKVEAPEPPAPVQPGSTTLMPPAPEPAPSLLPGAPPPSRDEEGFATYARGFGDGLIAEGTRLRNTSAPEPARKTFMLKVQVWRGQMRKLIRDFGNYKTKESLTTTLLSFDDKMRSLGSELGIDNWKDE
jgi:hypothetical protein